MGTMTLEQAIRNAIDVERAAARFYRLLGESTQDRGAREFLAEMAKQEDDHAAAIERVGREIAAGELPGFATGEVEVVESAPEWRFADDVSFLVALQIAREAESHAWLYYDALADTSEGRLHDFFHMLARAEEQHVKALDERLAALRG